MHGRTHAHAQRHTRGRAAIHSYRDVFGEALPIPVGGDHQVRVGVGRRPVTAPKALPGARVPFVPSVFRRSAYRGCTSSVAALWGAGAPCMPCRAHGHMRQAQRSRCVPAGAASSRTASALVGWRARSVLADVARRAAHQEVVLLVPRRARAARRRSGGPGRTARRSAGREQAKWEKAKWEQA